MVTVLAIHTGAALAQQGAPPGQEAVAAPEAQPAPAQEYPPGYSPPPGYAPAPGYAGSPQYAPPQGYGPPPPRYSYYPPPPPPPAQRSSSERSFMLGGSLGMGGLRFHDDLGDLTSEAAFGYSGRLGFGIAPRMLLLVGVDGAAVSVDGLAYDQAIYYMGLQLFLSRQFFVRGGAGFGNITGRDNYGNFLYFGKTGFGLTASLGVELLQGYNWSLELAGQVTSGFYKDERWTGGTVNIGFNFF